MLLKDVQPVIFDEDAIWIIKPAIRWGDVEIRAVRVGHSNTGKAMLRLPTVDESTAEASGHNETPSCHQLPWWKLPCWTRGGIRHLLQIRVRG